MIEPATRCAARTLCTSGGNTIVGGGGGGGACPHARIPATSNAAAITAHSALRIVILIAVLIADASHCLSTTAPPTQPPAKPLTLPTTPIAVIQATPRTNRISP